MKIMHFKRIHNIHQNNNGNPLLIVDYWWVFMFTFLDYVFLYNLYFEIKKNCNKA